MKLTIHHLECHIKQRSFVANLFNNSVIEMERQKYLKLKNGETDVFDKEEMSVLKDQNFLVKNEEEDKDLLKKRFFMSYGNSLFKSKEIITSIMLTDHCNLNCNYCLMKNELNKKKMSFETANKTIRFYENLIKHNNNIKNISVQFTGGEPTLSMPIMETIINGLVLISQKYKVKIGFVITSNGTVDISDYAGLLNKYKVHYRLSYSPSEYSNKGENRYGYDGKDKNKNILENIKKLFDAGYNYPIKIVYCADRIFHKKNSKELFYDKEEEKEELVRKQIFKDFSNYGISKKKIVMSSLFSALSPNYSGYIPESIKIGIEEGGYARKINISEIKRCYINKYLGIKNKKSMKKVPKEEVDMSHQLLSFTRIFECCAFREGRIINITPDGLVRPLIPAYGKKEFIAGKVDDDIKVILLGFKKIKKEAAWMKDENCMKCNIATRCFGGCVQNYHPINPNKPSLVCSKEILKYIRRVIFKRQMRDYIKNYNKE